MKLKSLTPNLIVKSVNQTLSFYEQCPGFVKLASVPEEGELAFALIKLGDVSMMIQSKESLNDENPIFKNQPIGGTIALYIDVEDIAALYKHLKGKSELIVDTHDTFYGTREFSIKDPNGYLLTFAEDIK